MQINKIYDLLIIGGGISSSVFVTSFLQDNREARIAIVEAGRFLGGRSTTRFSNKYKDWQLNHGSPNLNISNNTNNKELKLFINYLLHHKIIEPDNSDFIELSSKNKLNSIKNNQFSIGKNYLSTSSMSDLSRNIIALNNLRNQIDFYFETLIVKLDFNKNHWLLFTKNGEIFRSQFLVCSSSLLLHKRSKEILNTIHIPLRQSIPKYNDKNIDFLFDLLSKQSYIPRLSFLIYTNLNYVYKDNYLKKYRYFFLSKDLQKKYKIERVIFQLQQNNKLGIVIHTKNIDFIGKYIKEENEAKFKKIILNNFNLLFEGNPLINKLINYEGISIMLWRASQPNGVGVPDSLQIFSNYKIGFCGDWFQEDGFGRIEGSIISALKLSKRFKLLI